jgi:hypothetical protein
VRRSGKDETVIAFLPLLFLAVGVVVFLFLLLFLFWIEVLVTPIRADGGRKMLILLILFLCKKRERYKPLFFIYSLNVLK